MSVENCRLFNYVADPFTIYCSQIYIVLESKYRRPSFSLPQGNGTSPRESFLESLGVERQVSALSVQYATTK